MRFVLDLVTLSYERTLVSLSHNWPYLVASVLIAAILKVFLDGDRVSVLLKRSRGIGILAATGVAVATPLCSCGTTAVILGMMAASMPWAPIVAFMVASPLSSPEGLVYSAGIFGWPFAIAYFGSSILLGLLGGLVALLLDRMGLLAGQLRFQSHAEDLSCVVSGSSVAIDPCSCACTSAPPPQPVCCGVAAQASTASGKRNTSALLRAILDVSKFILPMFIGFAFLGYLLNGLVPASLMATLFGRKMVFGVPLAASVGLPLYINSEASIPLARAFMDSGMSPGAIMAFLIAGSGTSVGAIGGALTIARWRVVALVVFVLWMGAIGVGYGYNGLLALGCFG